MMKRKQIQMPTWLSPRVEIENVFGDRLRFGFPSGLNTPGIIDEKQLDFRDTLTHVRGNHVIKIGGDLAPRFE